MWEELHPRNLKSSRESVRVVSGHDASASLCRKSPRNCYVCGDQWLHINLIAKPSQYAQQF